MAEPGILVLNTDGQWMILPPERCGRGHLLKGNCLVNSVPCSCGPRHHRWECNCGDVVYGPALGPDCKLLHGAARVH